MTKHSEAHTVELREGLRLSFAAGYPITPRELYFLTVVASGMLQGKLVVCENFLPGVTLDIETRWRPHDGQRDLEGEWISFQEYLLDWVEESEPGLWSASCLRYTTFVLSRGDAYKRAEKPAIEIVRRLAWDTAACQPNLPRKLRWGRVLLRKALETVGMWLISFSEKIRSRRKSAA